MAQGVWALQPLPLVATLTERVRPIAHQLNDRPTLPASAGR